MLRHKLYRAAVGLLALAVALLTARVALTQLHALTSPVPAVIARTVIPPYTPITAGMVEVVYLPQASITGPVYTDPDEVVGLLARLELLPGSPILRSYAVPAAELRYTTNAQAVVLGLVVDETQVPADLLRAGQRVDVWRAGQLVGPGLRVVAIVNQADGGLLIALEADQTLVPALLAASGQPDTALTLAPLERLAMSTESPTEVPTEKPTNEGLTERPTEIPTEVPTENPTEGLTKDASSVPENVPESVSSIPTTPGSQPKSRPKSPPTPGGVITVTESTTESTTAPGAVVVKPELTWGVNVRAGPGTSYPVLAILQAGTRLTPVGRDPEGRWVQVCCLARNQAGWMLAELVELTVDLEALPVR